MKSVMDPVGRRAALAGRPNPTPRRDTLVILEDQASVRQPPVDAPWVRLAYIPDRVILDTEAFEGYLQGLARWVWPGLEELAQAIIDDMGNELIPRWMRVEVREPRAEGRVHRVVLEERQPLWRGDVPRDVAGF